MNILLFSDSHGAKSYMADAINAHGKSTDLIIHLGDHIRDAQFISDYYPQFRYELISGNCDGIFAHALRILELEGKRILITHGHTLGVKSGLEKLYCCAVENKCDAAFFGHTHQPLHVCKNGIHLVNPGCAPSYARISITENGFEVNMNKY